MLRLLLLLNLFLVGAELVQAQSSVLLPTSNPVKQWSSSTFTFFQHTLINELLPSSAPDTRYIYTSSTSTVSTFGFVVPPTVSEVLTSRIVVRINAAASSTVVFTVKDPSGNTIATPSQSFTSLGSDLLYYVPVTNPIPMKGHATTTITVSVQCTGSCNIKILAMNFETQTVTSRKHLL